MPRYSYVHPKTNKIIERVFRMGKAPKSIRLSSGTKCNRCLPAEIASQGGMQSSTWPMKSIALAVHPSQRQQYAEFSQKHGVPTHFDEKGHPEFRTREHRKQYAELVGATDFDGGYNDPHCD